MKSKKKKIILSILLAIVLLLISFSTYYVIDYNKGEFATHLKTSDKQQLIVPIPKWTKVEKSLYKGIIYAKSYLKQEEIEKFYNDVFYSKAKKVMINKNPSDIAYCDIDKKLCIEEIVYRTDEKFTFYQIFYDGYNEFTYQII